MAGLAHGATPASNVEGHRAKVALFDELDVVAALHDLAVCARDAQFLNVNWNPSAKVTRGPFPSSSSGLSLFNPTLQPTSYSAFS